MIKTYLVGGAVRDQLLGLPVKEKDWVVVGATVDDMLRKGFRQVGKDFPVFLHPVTHEEYALARTERKIKPGYTGFLFHSDPHVTLEDDLKRRDLTINAMAQTNDGEIIDPFRGKDDLAKKILRHVSEAFVEDPVRILRTARFSARFDFEVAPETLQLMRHMVDQGEVEALVAERVWKELERALLESYPKKFFDVLHFSGADKVLFPQEGIPEKGIERLVRATALSREGPVRFAALFSSCEETLIRQYCKRYRVSNEYAELALLVNQFLPSYQKVPELSSQALLDLLLSLDAFRRERRFNHFLLASEACSMPSFSEALYDCFKAANKIDIRDIVSHYQGQKIAEKIKEKRQIAIEQWLLNR